MELTPGAIVRAPSHPEWGDGQVQSAIGHRVTVGFVEAGKVTIDIRHVRLVVIREARGGETG